MTGTVRAIDFVTYQGLCDLIFEEAACLDEQRWDDWLALYGDDATFWMPAWNDEFTLTGDPTREVSLVYIDNKVTLSDRVWRWSSGDSPASLPLPRTSHVIGNVRVTEFDGHTAVVTARWHNQVFRKGRTWSYAGTYRHRLRRVGGQWRIVEKYIVLTNDLIVTTLDLYHV